MDKDSAGAGSSIATRHELLKLSRKFQAKKRLGQHFLVEPDVLARIAQALELSAGDHVLEIGSGLGFLTRFLTATGAGVTAVELDASAVTNLREQKLSGLHIVEGDFLRFDPRDATTSLTQGRKLKVAGNVPYQITSKIIAHLFGEIDRPSPWLQAIDRVVLTVQLEVARRFVAAPGTEDYSQISILVNYYSTAELLQVVPAECFFPEPQVNSAVVLFRPKPAPAVECSNTRLLRQVIQAGFRQRRKMLRNNLSFLPVPPENLLSIFSSIHLDPQTRAERLSLKQFGQLTDALEAFMIEQGLRRPLQGG